MDAEPLVRITWGSPAPDELAVLVTVLLARAHGVSVRPNPPVSRWARSARPTATTLTREPGGWRAAALPR